MTMENVITFGSVLIAILVVAVGALALLTN
jgi:hypothetical protein